MVPRSRCPYSICGLLSCAVLAVCGGWGYADVIPIFSSGVDAGGNVLAPGSVDPHYDIMVSADGRFTPPDAAIVQLNHPAWLANDPAGSPGSSWISIIPGGTTNIAAGDYEFRTQFDLTGLKPATATITARVAVDNTMTDMRLNGDLLSISRGGFNAFQSLVTIDSGFVNGVNTLDFLVNNAGTSPNPGGFRVEIMSAEADVIPEPATMALLGLGALAMIRRRRA